MKNVTNQYKDLLEGKITKNHFMKNVRMALPNFIGPSTSYEDAITILKGKRIISEEITKQIENKKSFSGLINEAKTNSGFTYVQGKDQERNPVDYVDPYQLKRGVELELSKMADISGDAYKAALQKAANNLKKDPYFYKELQIANFDEVKKYDEKLKMKKVSAKEKKETKADGYLKKEVKKSEPANTKASKTENKKGKPKGIQVMKESSKSKVISELMTVKKKINEDTHWKYHTGSEVITPEGPGVVKDIAGGTISVEMGDGTIKDYQVNVLDRAERDSHFSSMPNKFSKFQTPFEEKEKHGKSDKMMEVLKKLKQYFFKKKVKEATKFNVGGDVVVKKSGQETQDFQNQLTRAGAKFTKSNV